MCRDYFLGKLTAFEDKDAFMAIESNLNTAKYLLWLKHLRVRASTEIDWSTNFLIIMRKKKKLILIVNARVIASKLN